MFSLRMLATAAVALALPMACLSGERVKEPKDSDEYKLAALVVGGEVTSVKYLDGAGKDAREVSKGPYYRLVLKVAVIRKVKEASAEVGGEVTVLGRATDEKQKESYVVPKVGDTVIAFLNKKGTKAYEPVAPKTWFWSVSGSGGGVSPGRDKSLKDETSKDKKDR